GTIICIPILNVFGFLNTQRTFPDGRDLNRSFPGTKRGSLASRVAYHFTSEILPHADYCLDFHTGGASRFNAPQIRVKPNDKNLLQLAKIFNVPFTIYSNNLKKSYRATCDKMGIPIVLFEGGKSLESNKQIVNYGVRGTLRFLSHLGMLDSKFKATVPLNNTVVIEKSRWLRAQRSGLFHLKIKINSLVEKSELLATITDPYGTMRYKVLAPNKGYIINVNQSPIVHQGDAIFHISTKDGTTIEEERENIDE
ncbi:MAG: succinylglutamate desuccinylase/aspartoacylase family protein, partial [Flavobacteriaceae bacterium]